MSDYAFVADRAKKVFASVSRLESELAKKPDDWALSVNLKSMRKLAVQAREEMERLAKLEAGRWPAEDDGPRTCFAAMIDAAREGK